MAREDGEEDDIGMPRMVRYLLRAKATVQSDIYLVSTCAPLRERRPRARALLVVRSPTVIHPNSWQCTTHFKGKQRAIHRTPFTLNQVVSCCVCLLNRIKKRRGLRHLHKSLYSWPHADYFSQSIFLRTIHALSFGESSQYRKRSHYRKRRW